MSELKTRIVAVRAQLKECRKELAELVAMHKAEKQATIAQKRAERIAKVEAKLAKMKTATAASLKAKGAAV